MEESKKSLTQAKLKELLHYEPLTGVFTWLKLPLKTSNTKVGSIAGSKNTSSYIVIGIFRKSYKAHRLAYLYMTGKWPTNFIDHINGVRSSNIWTNLRECTHQQNRLNVGIYANNTSGFKGVYWCKPTNKWLASVKLHGKQHNLGLFATAEQASDVRQAFAKLHHGEFFKETM